MQKVPRNNKLEVLRYWRETQNAINCTSRVGILYKKRITLLEEENKTLQTSLENSQAEIEDLKAIVHDVNLKQGAANTFSERIKSDLKELHCRHVKLECHSRRGNMKFFGITERENETNNDTELALREIMRTKLKILSVDEENIHFDRV